MRTRLIRNFNRTFATLAAAARAANAVEEHRRPQASDLEILGIDPKGFKTLL